MSIGKEEKTLENILSLCPPDNQTIREAVVKCWSKINDPKYKVIICSVSGGADSDVMLDMVWRCDKDNKVTYVWFDTGLEYQATKDHLEYLKKIYEIEILSDGGFCTINSFK